jgi:hypothetical protein
MKSFFMESGAINGENGLLILVLWCSFLILDMDQMACLLSIHSKYLSRGVYSVSNGEFLVFINQDWILFWTFLTLLLEMFYNTQDAKRLMVLAGVI